MRPKFKGFRFVGGYWVPYQEAAEWSRRVKRSRKAAMDAMATYCPYVISQWKGSEDGEAVCGLDSKGDLVSVIHLDVDGVDLIEQGIKDGNLAEVLRDSNEADCKEED